MKSEQVLVIFTFLLLLLVSCQLLDDSPTTVVIPSLHDTPTIAHASTYMPQSSATAIHTVPMEILRYQNLNFETELPAHAGPTGYLLLEKGTRSYFYDFDQRTLQSLPENQNHFCASPDGAWFTHVEISEGDSITEKWLVVENGDGEQGRIAIQSTWNYLSCPIWLDSQRFMLGMYSEHSYPVSDMVIINPFSGETQALVTDYPNLDIDIHRSLSVSYDSRLELVLYHAIDQERLTVLWDRISQERVASFQLFGYSIPLWLPDDSGVLISASPERNAPEEWFRISREGKIAQLTNFGASFDDASISYYFRELSPDGRYLAFTLETTPNYCDSNTYASSYYLTILDLNSLQATDYCIPGGIITWSPDSRYLVILHSYEENSFHTILVSPFEGWAAPITVDEGLSPTGWWPNP